MSERRGTERVTVPAGTVPGLTAIREAADRIRPYIHRTPVLTCSTVNGMLGAELFFKCENFQKIGAFKIRGATNAVLALDPAAASRGVATVSSGNHAAALALTARTTGIPAYVVMPENSARVKIDAVSGYGAKIVFCAPTMEARERTLAEVVERTGAVLIHPYNDYRIIAGQATATLELIEEVSHLDVVMTPIGGGGLTSGAALAVHYLAPSAKMIAAEPEGANDAYRSFQSGQLVPSEHPDTIADGLRSSLGDKTFPIISRLVDDIVCVTEDGIRSAMRMIWERMKIIVEPSAAVPLGALLEQRLSVTGKRVGIILSGGNVDLERLPWTPAG
jgi:threonine dehydratase